MQTVYLNGNIDKFGSIWETECSNIKDIFKLIECQTPGFRQHLVKAAEAGVGYEIKRGSDFLEDEDELLLSLINEDIIITEVPAGSKSGGSKILAAFAIVALAFATGGLSLGPSATVTTTTAAGVTTTTTAGVALGATTAGLVAAGIAVNLALTGISQLLAPGPESDEQTDPSYLFNGPSNTITQGLPVPVAYGELIVGGAPISFSFNGAPTSTFNGNLDIGSVNG